MQVTLSRGRRLSFITHTYNSLPARWFKLSCTGMPQYFLGSVYICRPQHAVWLFIGVSGYNAPCPLPPPTYPQEGPAISVRFSQVWYVPLRQIWPALVWGLATPLYGSLSSPRSVPGKARSNVDIPVAAQDNVILYEIQWPLVNSLNIVHVWWNYMRQFTQANFSRIM